MKPCDVCLGLDRFGPDENRWQLSIKADLTAEYSVEFKSSQLSASVESGCETCSVISRGLELISRNLSLFDAARACRGRLILQPDRPLEVEIFDEEEEKEDSDARVRVQFYTLPGKSSASLSQFSDAECLGLTLRQEMRTRTESLSPRRETSLRNSRWKNAHPWSTTGLQIVRLAIKPVLPQNPMQGSFHAVC